MLAFIMEIVPLVDVHRTRSFAETDGFSRQPTSHIVFSSLACAVENATNCWQLRPFLSSLLWVGHRSPRLLSPGHDQLFQPGIVDIYNATPARVWLEHRGNCGRPLVPAG